MPGMGIGSFLPNEAIIKRKYRWTLSFSQANNFGGGQFEGEIKPIMVTIAARPNITIEETEINFLNEKDYIPAKPTWDPLQVTILDFGRQGGTGADTVLKNWIQRIYYFGDPANSGEMSDPAGFGRRQGTLTMYNGVGQVMETWTLYNCWAQAVNWGDLDYSATENATVELTVRFQNASVEYSTSAGAVAGPGDNSELSSFSSQ